MKDGMEIFGRNILSKYSVQKVEIDMKFNSHMHRSNIYKYSAEIFGTNIWYKYSIQIFPPNIDNYTHFFWKFMYTSFLFEIFCINVQYPYVISN